MFGFSREKNNLHFKMITIDAENNISIPVADIQGDSPGKTLLVIGGMDGDEYAGIEAAYQLAEKYASKNFASLLFQFLILPDLRARRVKIPSIHSFQNMYSRARQMALPLSE
jgi:hypothetical protein